MLGRLSGILVGMLSIVVLASGAPADAELSVAAMKGDMATVRALIDQGVDVNVPQGDGTTALHWAAYQEDVEMAELLLEAGADIGVKTRIGEMTPLFMAAKVGNGTIIELLLEAGADPNVGQTENGTTPLMLAAASGSVDAVRALLDAGVETGAKDINQGQTALMFAAAPGRTDVVRLLVERGADVDARSLVPDPRAVEGAAGPRFRRGDMALGGLAPLHFAARDGRIETVQALLELGADVDNLTASNNMSALTIAILNARFDLAMFLLEHGADPKPADSSEGVTALYATIDVQWANRVWYPPPTPEQEQVGYMDLLKEILAHSVDLDVRLRAKMWQRQMHGDWVNPAGATAFWRAAQANDVDAMRLLVAAGANPSIPSNDGVSSLMAATGWGFEPQTSTYIPDARLAAVRYLVEEVGADLNSKDKNGYTPLHGAGLTAEKNHEVIEYLVAMGADVSARADLIFGGVTEIDQEVSEGTGDTVADMANGPKAHNLVHLNAVDLLVDLGSENSGNCRASNCVNQAKPDAPKPGGQ